MALASGCADRGDAPALSSAAPVSAVRVVDGDTLVQAGVRHRLFGIDAPEARQRCTARGGGTWPCGAAATARLRALLEGARLRCSEVPGQRDRHGRRISRCTADGVDVAATLVAEGLAWAYRRYSSDYVGTEDRARSRGHGVWQAPTEAPWHVRRARTRPAGGSVAPSGCPIKGNVSAGGRIYHLPGTRSYARTVIRPERGERWFCSERQARAAGWRPAR